MLRFPRPSPSIRLLPLLIAATLAPPAMAGTQETDELAALSLEELGDVQVTSVSRRVQRLADAAASIYVISADDIRRSGVTSLPEALRLAPNLQVARVSASVHTISARGFNNSYGNKLLVLIDGRAVYTPLSSGVFWDAQDVMLEDVERIEVISGPGSTLWGANAVNGVINVITKRPGDTRGGLLALHGGSDGEAVSVRYGGDIGSGRFRAYARRYRIDRGESTTGARQNDGWDASQAGFRAEWGDEDRQLTLLGNVHDGESVSQPFGPVRNSGVNLLARWRNVDADGDEIRVQAYYDRNERDEPVLFYDRMEIVDLDFLHATTQGRHALTWGGGWRQAHDRVRAGVISTFLPNRKTLHWYNLFVQDGITLGERTEATLGLKWEHNSYTGGEWLPSARIAWKASDEVLVWGALSRAVRTPSRIDREFYFPATPPFILDGGPNFVSETANVAELGVRASGEHTQWSLTAFHSDYDRLRSGQPGGTGYQVENRIEGTVSGLEGWATWQVTPRWRLAGGGMWQDIDLRLEPGSLDPDGTTAQGNDPEWQWQLRSSLDVGANHEFELAVRGVDALPDPHIPAYTSVDLGWAWRPVPALELWLSVTDVFDDGHTEFEQGVLSAPSHFGRSTWLALDWQW